MLQASSFTARLEITADGGATIDDAGFWMGTDSSAYNAGSNTYYAISPTVTTIGVKTLQFHRVKRKYKLLLLGCSI